MRTAVYLHRAKRRTRQVFRQRLRMPVIVTTLLVIMASAGIYFLSANPRPPETPLETINENSEAEVTPSAVPVLAQPETIPLEAVPETRLQEEESPEKTYPIDTHIQDPTTTETLFGDEKFDASLPTVCTTPIQDAKRDVENVYAFKLQAQEEFEKAEQAYLHQKEKTEEAHAELVKKRQKLDAIRIGCITEEKPFGDASRAYLDSINR